jgi:hypothetical protein
MRKGKHWSHDGEVLRIFDVYSSVKDKQLFIGESADCQTKAMAYERASQALTTRIGYLEGLHHKSMYRVLYIQINEYMAHLLFDEGYLDIPKLEAADEDDKSIFIPMVFNNRRRIFAIRNDITQAALYFSPTGKPLSFY